MVKCGSTVDEAECACGCSGYDERCDVWTEAYVTRGEVPEWHTCCKVGPTQTARRAERLYVWTLDSFYPLYLKDTIGFWSVQQPHKRYYASLGDQWVHTPTYGVRAATTNGSVDLGLACSYEVAFRICDALNDLLSNPGTEEQIVDVRWLDRYEAKRDDVLKAISPRPRFGDSR